MNHTSYKGVVMEIKKRDYLLLLLIIAIMGVTSCMVEDTRAMMPPEKTTMEKAVDEVNKHIHDAYYITYLAEPDREEEEDIEEYAEEVYVEDIAQAEEECYTEDSINYEYLIVDDSLDEIPYTEEPGLIYLGTYEITAYEYTGSMCANGNYPTPWYTVASNYFDFGTTLYIDGVGYVIVEDRGAVWHGDDWLDLYIGDVNACYEWGVQYRDVYLVE